MVLSESWEIRHPRRAGAPDALPRRQPHIALRRESEPGAVRIHLNEVRYLADAMRDRAAQSVGRVVGKGARRRTVHPVEGTTAPIRSWLSVRGEHA